MNHIIPTLQWYTSVSEKKGLAPRCPFANVYKCPKYYQSLSLLKETGTTGIDEKEEIKLKEYWNKSELNPVLKEEMPGLSKANTKFYSIHHFCPEVTYQKFGYFAESLSEFADEYDRHERHRYLESEIVDRNDWRWHFQHMDPLHYTGCSYYSILLNSPVEPPVDEGIKFESTESQKEDYKKYKYKCKYRINIIGNDTDPERKNYIEIDGNGIELGDIKFIIFMKLVTEIKRNMEGWVEIERFIADIGLTYTGIHQLIGRLKDNLAEIRLIDRNDVNKLIENNKNKMNSWNKKGGFYRISNHPDFISYDKEKLMQVDDSRMKSIIKQSA